MIKQILVFARKSMRLTILIAVSIFLIICAVALFFKPIYAVTINGEDVGYSKDKSKLQSRINAYIEKGEGGENSNIAFVQVEHMPEYKMCLLKRNIVTNDEEIFEKIKQSGVTYYKFFAILEGDEQKAYVSDFAKAEEIVNQLKKKDSSNIDKISILEMYETELKDFAEVDATVAALYKKKVVVVKKTVNTASSGLSFANVPLGINFINPTSGIISSRYGVLSSIRDHRHGGLDIAAPTGTPIKAVAAGTVTYSGPRGTFGNLVIINHGNGIETYYSHCSKLFAVTGQQVNQGDIIANVGSTGRSTGPHLHFEVRINGVQYNPQNYVY